MTTWQIALAVTAAFWCGFAVGVGVAFKVFERTDTIFVKDNRPPTGR